MAEGTCSVSGCERQLRGGGLCNMHYLRLRKRGELGGAAPERARRPPQCIVDGCKRSVKGHGLCKRHYYYATRYGTPTPRRPTAAERFWSTVEINGPDECWPSRGWPRGRGGHRGCNFEGHDQYAHRVAWTLTHGNTGERNGMAKLTAAQVRAIRAAYVRGVIRMIDLARRYRVSRTTISVIVNRRYWRSI